MNTVHRLDSHPQVVRGICRLLALLMVLAPCACSRKPVQLSADRLAVIESARTGGDADAIVDWVVEHDDAYLAARLLGNRIYPRVYHHLAPDKWHRENAVDIIALYGQPDRRHQAILRRVLAEHPSDEELQYIGQLLLAAASPSERATLVKLADRLEDAPAVRLWGSFPATREVALPLARRRLRELADRIAATSDRRDLVTRSDSYRAVLGLAAQHHALEPADVEIYDALEPFQNVSDFLAIGQATSQLCRWAATDNPMFLDKGLEIFGANAWIGYVAPGIKREGDAYFPIAKIGLLLARAADQSASFDIRRGAIELLAYVGPADPDRVVPVLKKLVMDKTVGSLASNALRTMGRPTP